MKDLNRRPLTNDVSFQVRAGEIVGLAGLVGSGRSELAQVIFGVTPAQSGEIRLNGNRRDDQEAHARPKGWGLPMCRKIAVIRGSSGR